MICQSQSRSSRVTWATHNFINNVPEFSSFIHKHFITYKKKQQKNKKDIYILLTHKQNLKLLSLKHVDFFFFLSLNPHVIRSIL